MKKVLSILLAMLMVVALFGCGDTGITQEEYDSIKSRYDNLQSDYSALQSEYDSIKSDLAAANKQVEDLLTELAERDELEEENKETESKSTPVDVFVYDDDYVEIHFIGCELDRDDEQLVFMVTNKTDSELTFQSGTMAIDGLSLGHVSGSDSIAAQSKGKVRFETKEDFPTMNPETISGTIDVIDFGKTLWGRQSYEVAFSNLDVTQ